MRIARPRRRIAIIAIVVVLIVLVVFLRSLAVLYTDGLWYSAIGQHEVFSTVLETKIGLFLTFGLVFFFAMWANLLLCNRLGPNELFLDAPEDELVRRFQGAVRPYAGRLYALLSAVLALIAASSAVGKWQAYLLFANAQSFTGKGATDPLFHKNIGFYVFTLPFLTFVVDWVLASLFAIIVFSAVFHYLNGGIRGGRGTGGRGGRGSLRASSGVKVHLSVLIALLAIAKAGGYLIAKWHMVTSTGGVVEGAGYTDVHARIPALTLLFWLCLIAAVILLVNIRQRGWTLPAIAIGLWAFVALAIGVIYPAIIQALKVTPSQSTLELPYIQRNINATLAAYNLEHVAIQPFATVDSKSPLSQPGVAASVSDIREWDPVPSIAQSTFQRVQALHNYYQITPLGEDRYMVDGKLTPVLEGVRELNSSGLPSQTWVTQHLLYTHGNGIVMAPSNAVQTSTDEPVFDVQNVPPVSSGGFPKVSQPGIYFGLSQNGYVVVDSKQAEFNDEVGETSHYSDYTSHYGVQAGGIFRRAMFAIRFGDLNFFLSNLISANSQVIFERNVVQIARRAAPFLSIDANPYAVVVNGQVDWVLDGYTTTDQYPYSQNADTQLVPTTTGLPSSYNYVRNSVKIIVNAYSGKVTLYAMTPNEPILKAWMSAFPSLFTPLGQMPSNLRSLLKYPQDIFSIQAAIFGRYHVTSAAAFYNNADGWTLTPTDGAGPPSNSIELSTQYDKQGYIVSQSAARMVPLYQIYAPPGSTTPQYTLTEAYVPAGSGATSSSSVLNMSAFMVALSSPGDYGQITVYRPPNKGVTIGPVQADSQMYSYQPASSTITLLHQAGSQVLLGNILMIPINGTMLYVRPMYVTSKSINYPLLRDFITVYGQKTGFATTLAAALDDVLGTPSSNSATSPSGLTVAQLLTRGTEAYARAETALRAGDLGLYQRDVNQMNTYDNEALALLSGSKKSSTKSQ